jgi:hypothetical protein
MRPLSAHCHVALAELYQRTGAGQQSRDHLADAVALYRELGMAHWLRQAERAYTEEG